MDLVAYLQWSSDTADPEKRKSKRYIISYEHFDMFYNLLFETAQACQRENKTIKAMEFIKKVQTMMDTDENIFTMIYGTKPGNQINVKGLFNMKSPKNADSFHFE